LIEEGVLKAKVKFKQLLLKHKPDKIIYSPYERTAHTARIAREAIFEVTGLEVQLECNKMVGEMMLSKRFLLDNFQEESIFRGIQTDKTEKEFVDRIRNFHTNLDENCWVITHRLVINTIVNIYDIKDYKVDYLRGVTIINNKLTAI
jgi:broad specificity phosphatase PhoE